MASMVAALPVCAVQRRAIYICCHSNTSVPPPVVDTCRNIAAADIHTSVTLLKCYAAQVLRCSVLLRVSCSSSCSAEQAKHTTQQTVVCPSATI
jgi:hypothetical protein